LLKYTTLVKTPLLKAHLLRFISFDVDQKSVLRHPRLISPGRADIFVHVFHSNAFRISPLSCLSDHHG